MRLRVTASLPIGSAWEEAPIVKRRQTLILMLTLLALVAAACGGDDDSAATTTAASSRRDAPTRIDSGGDGGSTAAAATTVAPATGVRERDAREGETPPSDVRFDDYGVGPRVDTREEAVSTFAVDVDTGAYTLMRAWVEEGFLPERDAVRAVLAAERHAARGSDQ